MKKASQLKKVILYIIFTLVVCWAAIFITNIVRSNSFKTPVFALPGEIMEDGGSAVYRGLGYKVDVVKTLSPYTRVRVVKVEMYMLGILIASSIE